MNDFFISYTDVDRSWAVWIAWILEEARYSVVIQAWDFLPGSNFVLEMERGATEADKTIAVLSPQYLRSGFTRAEWTASFAQDPEGKYRKLIPVRVAECKPTGILGPIIYVDLVRLPEKDARAALLGAFQRKIERLKPDQAPIFPGKQAPAYPGASNAIFEPVAQTLLSQAAQSAGNSDRQATLSPVRRLQFAKQLNVLTPQELNMLVFAVNPPAGKVPSMPTLQSDRISALLAWAEEPDSCGVSTLQQLLETIDAAVFRAFRKHLSWQWMNNDQPNSCYVALELFVYGKRQQAFTKLSHRQKDNPEAQDIYQRIRQMFNSESDFWMSVASDNEVKDLMWDQVQLHIEWQYKSHPGSLYRAWNAWQKSLSSGNKEYQIEAVLELLSGQKHNQDVMHLYRAAFATNPPRLMSMVHHSIESNGGK
jgi:hypothetical protein